MAQNRSFRDYITNRFYDELYAAIAGFLEDRADKLRFSSCWVRFLDSAELSDIEVKQVYVSNRPDMKIAFDVIVEAQIEISETDRNNDRYDDKCLWFRISCTGDLACNLDDFEIQDIHEYVPGRKQVDPMSDSLVPIIGKDQLEKEATAFLKRNYPEALKTPMAINPTDLAQRMGLAVSLKHITSDFSVFGLVHFHDCDTEYYDPEIGSYVQTFVSAGEMFVDPDAYFLRNLGSVNNTIVHECVHWDLHRKAFELERLYNEQATQIQCQVIGGLQDNQTRTATDWMEWQANTLTPRILMPLEQAKVKAIEFAQKYKQLLQTNEIIDIMQPVIDELAQFFGVSRTAAKIRMVDLGYEEAIGTFTYIDGRYVEPYTFRKDVLQPFQTFSINSRDAMFEGSINPDLKTKLQNGNFLFVDSHYCINHPKYITTDPDGQPRMTRYALLHVDECCLIFNLNIKKTASNYGEAYYFECVLCRDASSDIILEASFKPSDYNTETDNRAVKVSTYNKELAVLLQKLPNSFSETLKELMKWRGVTGEKLAEGCQVSAKTIQRMRNDEGYETTLETIIALCIGLKLPPVASNDLIRKSKFSLKYTDEHLAYQFLLNGYYSHTIFECNEMLEKLGFKPLVTEDM